MVKEEDGVEGEGGGVVEFVVEWKAWCGAGSSRRVGSRRDPRKEYFSATW